MENKKGIVLGMVIAAVFLVATVGSASAINITECTVITAPGTYDITAGITDDTAKYCIDIRSDDVIIDGGGHLINGVTAAAGRCGIRSRTIDEPRNNITIRNVEITNFDNGIYIAGMGDAPAKFTNVVIESCSIHDNGAGAGQGIHLLWVCDSTIRRNEVYNQSGTGTGCESGGDGIFLKGRGANYGWARNNTITCNNVHDNVKGGIFTKASPDYCNISYNYCHDNGEAGHGATGGIVMRCKQCDNNVIAYNNASNNYGDGIYCRGNINTFEYNTAISNTDDGIDIGTDPSGGDGGDYNELYDNCACGNGDKGITTCGGSGITGCYGNIGNNNTCDNCNNCLVNNNAIYCNYTCDTLVPTYFDFDEDNHYSKDPADCSCRIVDGRGECACCNPGLFAESGAAQHCAGCVCILTPGNDPNDCDADVTPPPIRADVTIEPETLNLKSNGEWVTAYIELPDGYDVADIDANTVLLDYTIPAVTDTQYGFVTDPESYLMDHDGDGIQERMVKFNRAAVIEYLGTYDFDYGDTGNHKLAELFVTGKVACAPFEGSDTVRVRV